MAKSRDRILIVESDPVLADLIGRQALQSAGYQISVAVDAGSAIAKAIQWAPHLIITDMDLPGLNGKDLMVALTSQKIDTPIILIARKGQEGGPDSDVPAGRCRLPAGAGARGRGDCCRRARAAPGERAPRARAAFAAVAADQPGAANARARADHHHLGGQGGHLHHRLGHFDGKDPRRALCESRQPTWAGF